MRDIYYKNQCLNMLQYDKVIDFIKENNPYIQDRTEPAKEEFAVEAVHAVIRGCKHEGCLYSTGGVVGSPSLSHKLVYLSVEVF